MSTMLRVHREFTHPAQKVFEAFLNPATLRFWYGPNNASVGEMKLEPVVGGRFDVELVSEKFGNLWVRGFFKEIIPYSKLCYTFIFDPDLFAAGDSMVTVQFTEQNGKTEVNVVQALQKEIQPQGRTDVWNDMLQKLEELLAIH